MEEVATQERKETKASSARSSERPSEERPEAHTLKGRYSLWTKWLDQVSYKGMVGNLPFLIFVTLLCVVYITNNNRAISLTRTLNEKNKTLKELRWRYMDLQSRLMFQTTETQLNQKAAALGLEPLTVPAFELKYPVKLEVTKK